MKILSTLSVTFSNELELLKTKFMIRSHLTFPASHLGRVAGSLRVDNDHSHSDRGQGCARLCAQYFA